MRLLLNGTLLLCLIFILSSTKATTIIVPIDYPAIQLAIDQSVSGDTVLVEPGTYYENINFRGKNIKLGSEFMLTNDTAYIRSTVIDGSQSLNADTGSCVIFNSGEDSTAALIGFTITNGTGTLWTDIHGAGIYREGGGILIELSSPTIMNNLIIFNQATDTIGGISSGGGGIRMGDSNPIIRNNIIGFNRGKYGAGLVMNYCGGIIRNNVITTNTGGQQFYGGSGIWILGDLGANPKIIENNTIVNNGAATGIGAGGIVSQSATNVFIRNCIVYDNSPSTQIKKIGGTISVTYCDVQSNYAGNGNFVAPPLLRNDNYLLDAASPCIDAGDSSSIYNDIEMQGNPGFAEFPCLGTIRNDVGAYGGQWSQLLASYETITSVESSPIWSQDLFYYSSAEACIRFTGTMAKSIQIYDLQARLIYSIKHFGHADSLSSKELNTPIILIRWIDEMGQNYSRKLAIR